MNKEFSYIVCADDPARLDKTLAQQITDLSRNQIQELIINGNVLCNGSIVTSTRHKLKADDEIFVTYAPRTELVWQPDQIEFSIVYEDEHVIVINKPAGLVMHPGAGIERGTLANGLLFHNPKASEIPRAGVVHRLDKDTSGICVCAKTDQAYLHLVKSMQNRKIIRKYKALVHGEIFAPGNVAEPIGRNPRNRLAMAVVSGGKPAKTNYNIAKRFYKFTWLDLSLDTGRTHQIRVHMAYINHPIAGDKLYNKSILQYSGIKPETISAIQALNRQALHAYEINFMHPIHHKMMTFTAEIPDDINSVLKTLG